MKRHWFPGLLIALALGTTLGWWRYWSWRERRYDTLIQTAAGRHQVDPAIVKAVIWRESRFDASARGRAGERGLMQIREPAARDWVQAEKVAGFEPGHLLDPATNTLVGTWYLGHLLKRYRQTDDPLPYALADYNAGRTRVLQWMQESARTNHADFLRRIDYPGTRRYIEAILARHPRYRTDFARSASPTVTSPP